jgi:[acyl-carrier-protein] S-malonyltransferase
VSGEAAAVEKVVQSVKALGRGRAIPLKVGAPFHSSIMAAGATEFERVLKEITLAQPQIPVVNNVAAAVESNPGTIRSCLVAQFRNPVQWVRTMGVLQEKGVDRYVEVGPRNVLTALAKKAVSGATLEAVEEMTWQ